MVYLCNTWSAVTYSVSTVVDQLYGVCKLWRSAHACKMSRPRRFSSYASSRIKVSSIAYISWKGEYGYAWVNRLYLLISRFKFKLWAHPACCPVCTVGCFAGLKVKEWGLKFCQSPQLSVFVLWCSVQAVSIEWYDNSVTRENLQNSKWKVLRIINLYGTLPRIFTRPPTFLVQETIVFL
jgi:hypothetical protein